MLFSDVGFDVKHNAFLTILSISKTKKSIKLSKNSLEAQVRELNNKQKQR